ncbi:MAG: DEAD/DEAH box helicase family protein [Phormidesmis sp.]
MSNFALRHWQQRASEEYQKTQPRIFTCLATPASGKTRFGLAIAQFLRNTSKIKQVVIFCHTDQIRRQWQAAAQDSGLELSVNAHQSKDGYIFSYQQLTDNSLVEKVNYLIRGRRRSLVILDEPHHLADAKAWGDGIKAALKRVHKILLLSGTLFRHDEGVIPFVSYRDGVLVPDFEYSYAEALKDAVVGPVFFPTFGGEASWQFLNKAETAQFGADLSDRDLSRQLNTAITSEDWLGSVIADADQRLQAIRQVDPAAGGLVTAKDIRHARIVAQVVERVTGEAPAIAISDNRKADEVISAFAASKAPWLVAVRMVSEGVDIPRLRVGVYATNILTELFFRQVVGRLVRTEGSFTGQDAYLYIPQHPVLLKYAMGIAEERYYVLPELSIPGSHSTREVFSFLEPVSAIAQPGEILSPVALPNGELLAMLHQGLALLDQAQTSIGQARDLFNQVAVALPVSAPEHSPISREPQRLSLSDAENHLLTLLAVHRGPTSARRS